MSLCLADTYTDFTLHIGLNDVATVGTYVWSADPLAPASYLNWHPGDGVVPPQPDGGQERCNTILIGMSGWWADIPCNNAAIAGYPSLCEKPMC